MKYLLICLILVAITIFATNVYIEREKERTLSVQETHHTESHHEYYLFIPTHDHPHGTWVKTGSD